MTVKACISKLLWYKPVDIVLKGTTYHYEAAIFAAMNTKSEIGRYNLQSCEELPDRYIIYI